MVLTATVIVCWPVRGTEEKLLTRVKTQEMLQVVMGNHMALKDVFPLLSNVPLTLAGTLEIDVTPRYFY